MSFHCFDLVFLFYFSLNKPMFTDDDDDGETAAETECLKEVPDVLW